MAKKYFIKELAGNGFLVNGRPVPFEFLEGNLAVVALDDTDEGDKVLIAGLTASLGKNSIASLTEEEYNLKKNEFPLLVSKPSSHKETLRLLSANLPQKRSVVAGVKPNVPAQPIKPAPTIIDMPQASSPDLLGNAFKPNVGKGKTPAASPAP